MSAGALVKTDEQEVINFLLTTEIIPLCLRIMESGSELSKTVFVSLCLQTWIAASVTRELSWVFLSFLRFQVATFILQKILLDDTGLAYICQTYERFSHVAMILVSSPESVWVNDSFQLRELRQAVLLWFVMSFCPSGQNGAAALQRAVGPSAQARSPLLLAPL